VCVVVQVRTGMGTYLELIDVVDDDADLVCVVAGGVLQGNLHTHKMSVHEAP
jgi:hypothetical protein